MSEPYQILTFIPDGVGAERAMTTLDQILTADGGTIEDDCYLYLNDVAGQELDPEPITDGGDARARLAAHPTLGSINYVMPEAMVTLTLHGAGGRVNCVSLSIPQRTFDNGGEPTRARYEQLARALHEGLAATRTIFDWGIEARGLEPAAELARLRRGERAGDYALDLLRPAG